MDRPDTPNCDRLAKHQREFLSMSHFLGWLAERGHTICNVTYQGEEKEDEVYTPLHGTVFDLLSDYFKIDHAKVDEEQRAISRYLLETHGEAPPPDFSMRVEGEEMGTIKDED